MQSVAAGQDLASRLLLEACRQQLVRPLLHMIECTTEGHCLQGGKRVYSISRVGRAPAAAMPIVNDEMKVL